MKRKKTVIVCVAVVLVAAVVVGLGVRYGWIPGSGGSGGSGGLDDTDLRYGFVPGFGVVDGEGALYTNSGSQEFDYRGEGRGELVYVAAAGDELTINLAGEFTDGRERNSTRGGGGGKEASGVLLKVGDAEYTTTSYSDYVNYNAEFGMTYVFPVPTGELAEGTELTLVQEGSEDVTFELRLADRVADLSDIGAVRSNERIDVAADFTVDEDKISVQLYHVNHTDLDFVCYGYGGGFSLALAPDALCLRADGEELYCLEPDGRNYYPTRLTFENTNAAETLLELPFVILKEVETAELHEEFASVEEALEYSETVELENCALEFAIEQLDDGSLALGCVITGGTDTLKPIALENPVGGLTRTVMATGRDGETRITSVLADSALTDTLTLDFELGGVFYAAVTDFEFPVG